mgnify:CR=1 FL=1
MNRMQDMMAYSTNAREVAVKLVIIERLHDDYIFDRSSIIFCFYLSML